MIRRLTRAAATATLLTAAACTNTFEVRAPEAAPSSSAVERTDEGTPVPGGRLRIGVESTVVSLDPAHNITQNIDHEVALAVYDPLVRYSRDPAHAGEVEPWLLTTWSASPDDRRWTLTVRTGVTFSDGAPFDARSIVANYDRNRGLGANCSCDLSSITSLTAPDASTVVVELDKPLPRFVQRLTDAEWYPVSPRLLASGGDPNRTPTGTGPFVLTDRDTVTLRRNPSYWRTGRDGRKLPYLDEVRVVPLLDSQQRLTALRNGDVDMIQTAEVTTITAARKDRSLETQLVTATSSTISMSNVSKPPFDDPRFRRVTAMAFDRQALSDQLYGGSAKPAYWLFPEGSPWHDAAAKYPARDVEGARKLLAEIVRDKGEAIKRFTISCIKTPETDAVLQLVVQQFREVGLEPQLELLDQGAYVAKILSKSGNYQGGCFRSADAVDPSDHGRSVRTGSPGNLTFYSNPEVDRLLDQADTERDPTKRRELLNRFQEVLAKAGPFAPLLYGQWANVTKPAVDGLPAPEVDSLGSVRLDGVWIER